MEQTDETPRFLSVLVESAQNLVSMDYCKLIFLLTHYFTAGKSDPFVELYIEQVPQVKRRTRVVYNSLSPEWNERFGFTVPAELIKNAVLNVRVVDKDLFLNDNNGSVRVPLKDLHLKQGEEVEVVGKLTGVETGTIKLTIKAVNFSIK